MNPVEEFGADRLIGWVRGDSPGPMLICFGGLHGNEPAGVEGLKAIVQNLERRRADLKGDFVAVRGNVQALAQGKRFLEYDLNRSWRAGAVDRLEAEGGEPIGEDAEMLEIVRLVRWAVGACRGPLYAVDLHTSSADGGAFTTVGDSLANRHFAMNIPVPLILGLEELIEGTLVAHLNELGFITAVFESGQHNEQRAVDRAEWGTWLLIRGAGLFGDRALPEADEAHRHLSAGFGSLPRVLEMRYRHPIEPFDGYVTRPGLANFQTVAAGEVLADDRHGQVVSPEDGRLLMPLYQDQGEDGFFVIREFSRLWLRVSEILRRLRVGRIVHWLPGVYRDPGLPGALVADRRVARWYALELFHLLGYRRHLEEGNRLVVVQRKAGPSGVAPAR